MAHAHAHADAWGPTPGAGRWGHFAPQILIASIGATVLLAVTPLPVGSVVSAVAPALVLGIVVTTWIQMRSHDRGMCERCLSAMPLNPSESAQRYRRRLAVVHLGGQTRVIVGYLAVLLGADLGLAVAPDGLMRVAVVLWACAQSSLVYLVLSHVTHRRLQPWCAQCGGGGGDDVHTPTPSPVDSRTG